ncbi:hypothetical protein EI546_10285 [Aequorivita sp. H23M31]|uniref:Uncharacterized protein n=1 Tax=Aequorivita ciconiae TaxID=2494375 RepID=A0A410G479_9FLAO|nr:hypothetical protein [Aequorivita sp. H23M31]QAA82084.1 hypothetical protein EI546_10285 [Aequorivita sp. H23M31]
METMLKDWKLLKTGQLVGDFEGFNESKIYELTDGSFYYQTEDKFHHCEMPDPVLKIYTDGTKQILVPEGLNDYTEIQETTAFRCKVMNDFRGWSGDTIFELENGEWWKQDQYEFKYFYSYRPSVVIAKVGDCHILHVNGRNIRVKRLK